ncbi:MAG: TlpA family protein disulfide reductase [Bacteriovorax sp.]|nr:TlpA family protein disulfide reductase [Bacteriovorax sp.]
MNRKIVFNTIFFAIAIYALYLRVPGILTHFKFQDQRAADFTIRTLTGKNFKLSLQSKKIIIVFWATWGGPCEVELKRINKMIIAKEILPNDVIAISSVENEKTIYNTVKKENYLFDVGIDADNSVAKTFEVSATPTIMFLDENQIINWMTDGFSPTLEYRISSFLK